MKNNILSSNLLKYLVVILLVIIFCTFVLTGCIGKKEKILIYTSTEDYRVEYLRKRLAEEFPSYDITIEYMTTGNLAAKIMAEGTATECDIIYSCEYGYLEALARDNVLANLSGYDTSIYTDDVIISNYYIPDVRNGGAIIVNPAVLKKNGLDKPQSYEDLLKPEYKNLISMPNPKSSGTGYMFLKSLINAWGEEEAFKYFDKLTENILQYTASGSGPVNALVQGEVAIGLGMTAQAVTKMNEGVELEILFFEEGSPYSMYGQAIIRGKENKKGVKEIFDFIYGVLGYEVCELYFPEQIFKDKVYEIDNYPSKIGYADMSNNTLEEKERILEKWKY